MNPSYNLERYFPWSWMLMALCLFGCQGSQLGSSELPELTVQQGQWVDPSAQMGFEEARTQSFQTGMGKYTFPDRGNLWLEITLQNKSTRAQALVLNYDFLAQVTLYDDSAREQVRYAGYLRPAEQIIGDDGPNHLSLVLAAQEKRRLYLKIESQGHLQPGFTLGIVAAEAFRDTQVRSRIIDALLGGALLILLIYIFGSFLNHQSVRSYLYMGGFMLTLGLYSLSLNGYLIAWFAPNDPQMAWAFNEPLYHGAILFSYLFGISFYQTQSISGTLHKVFWGLIAYVALKAIFCFFYVYHTGEAGHLIGFNIVSYLFEVFVPTFLLLRHLSRFSRYQRFVIGAVVIVSFFSLIRIILFFLDSDSSILYLAYLANMGAILSGLIFSLGFVAESRRTLEDRNAALAEINRIEKIQNEKLEELVIQRTQEVRIANASLVEKNEILAEKNLQIQALIQEVHHRVKNNLQMVNNLLEARERTLEDDGTVKVLEDSRSRIKSIALLHQKLYEIQEDEFIWFDDYVRQLFMEISAIFRDDKDVQFHLRASRYFLKMDLAVVLGLILNELLTNAFKYGFDPQQPRLHISLSRNSEDKFVLEVTDNGCPRDPDALPSETGFGLRLVRRLSRQLQGQLQQQQQQGTSFLLEFSPVPGSIIEKA